MVFSGLSPDRELVEFIELPSDVHPYFVATQAHPEFLSRPHRAHPLFAGLVEAGLDRQRGERLVEVPRDGFADGYVPAEPVPAHSA
jgi:CTP synthase